MIVSGPVNAAPRPATAPVVLPDKDRIVPGGRNVQIRMPQTEIDVTIDTGRIALAPRSSILEIIIMASVDDTRKITERNLREKALATARPVRQSLSGFDVRALAEATTRAALGKIAWFDARNIAMADDDNANAAPAATVTYRYTLSPDFSQIRVAADLSLTGASQQTAIYRQTITSIVHLNTSAFQEDANVARWSADDGKLAKAALQTAFGQIERLIPYALNLTAKDAVDFAKREKAFAAGFYAPLIEAGADGSRLLWAKDGVLHVSSVQ